MWTDPEEPPPLTRDPYGPPLIRDPIYGDWYEDPDACWFTVLAEGLDWLQMYTGHPAEIDPVHSGPVEFERTGWGPDAGNKHGSDACEWRYVGKERP
jgi:hypothetical protein